MARRDGQIIPKGAGKWRLRWCVGKDPVTGKYRYHSETFRGTKTKAQKQLRGTLEKRDRGEYVEPTNETLDAYLKGWLEKAARQKVRARTLADYRYMLTRYVIPTLGTIHLQRLRPLDIQALVADLGDRGLSPRTIKIAYRVLKGALDQAVRWQMISRNPTDGVELPRGETKEMHALSREEVERLRSALSGDRFAVLFDLALATGMRPSEYLGLRWQDVDLGARTVRVEQVLSRTRGSKPRRERASWTFERPKTKRSRRTLPIPPELVTALGAHRVAQAEHALRKGREYNRSLDLVFATSTGQPLSDRNLVLRHFKPALRRAELPQAIRLYDLRHTTCTLLLAAGIPVNVVSERLGHASAAMTLDVYGHVLPGQQEEATEKLSRLIYS